MMADDEGIDIGPLIEDLANDDSVERGDKLAMFVSLVDPQVIMKQLAANALMVKLGISPPSPVDAFAAAVIRLGRPELFPDD